MRVRDLSPRAPISAACSETLRSAATRLIEDEIGALLIYGSHGPVGIFSERDLTRAIADGANLDTVQIKDYMTDAPVAVDQNDKITTGISKMNEYGVRHLMVIDGVDVVGVVSMRDVVAHLDGHPARV